MSDSQVEVYYQEDENGEWYTAIIQDEVFQMNGAVDDLQSGYNQFIGTIGYNGVIRDQFGEEIDFEDCPENIQDAIQDRIPDE